MENCMSKRKNWISIVDYVCKIQKPNSNSNLLIVCLILTVDRARLSLIPHRKREGRRKKENREGTLMNIRFNSIEKQTEKVKL